ncbi:hypothetical protein F9C28_15870 [Shimwellia pseudoproteus]|nr:hypothetical protein [Shimwellia pseudoproteus]
MPNVVQELNRLVDAYIKSPSLIRNKIAHGQWLVALNRENTHINSEMATTLVNLDVVELTRFKDAFARMSRIVEDIIKSPNKAHLRDYWPQLEEFKRKQKEMSLWTVSAKISQLKNKYSHSENMRCEACGQLHTIRTN